jgi:hypothetical protein
LLSTALKQGKLQNGNVPVFGSIEALVSFFFVWCVCVITGYKMMVRPGSCRGRCTQLKSRGVVVEGFTTEKISSASFLFCG